MSFGWDFLPARVMRLALVGALGFTLLAPNAHAQSDAPEAAAGVPVAPQAAPEALDNQVHRRPLRVIARFRGMETTDTAGVASVPAIAGAQDRLARRLWNRGHSMPGWHAFRTVPAIVMEVDPSSLASLAIDPEVEGVEEDRLAKPDLATSVPLVGAPTAWSMGYTGAGVGIAILDTGVEASHPFFGGRVVHEACFSSNVPTQGATSLCPNGEPTQTGAGAGAACSGMGGCGHGTHVAGIAAGYQSSSMAGVARDAQIVAIQVFSRFSGSVCGSGQCVLSYTSDQIRALDYVRSIRATYNIASVNMSLGGGVHATQSSCDLANQSTKAAIDALRAAGTVTVIASGNDGYVNAMSEPACISSAVSVGNTTDNDNIFIPSNIASFLTMMAPGTGIRSSIPGGLYGNLTGTSMSTPHVAGALAILRQASPSATVGELVSALRNGGQVLSLSLRGSSGTTYNYSVPRLDVVGSVNAVRGNVTPATGWWWNPSEPGRGFSLETRNGRLFLGAFLYEDDGSPRWFVVNAPQNGSSFSGPLQRFGSGQTLSGDYRAPQMVGTVGTATLNFTTSTNGTITWPGGTIAIQRFPVNGQSVAAPQGGSPTAGWWWSPNESGTGWFFEVQDANIFISGYLYDAGGNPVWYVGSGPMLSASAFDGNLQLYGGGQTLTGSYRAPSSSMTVGQVSLRFSGSSNATLTLPQGRTINLARFTSF